MALTFGTSLQGKHHVGESRIKSCEQAFKKPKESKEKDQRTPERIFSWFAVMLHWAIPIRWVPIYTEAIRRHCSR